MHQRGLVGLSRHWRVITVAGLATLGLAYGAGQPLQGEWWPLTKAKPEATKAAATKPAHIENGFSSTIQRLMSDARLHADKGELDKAVQLAERAAKISDASAQLLGPSSDYSPEKTAQFANELRARRDAVARRTVPTPVAPIVAVAAPKPRPTTPRSREIPPDFPPQLLEQQVVERAVVEPTATVSADTVSADTVPPALFAAESRDNKLAWAEELPPTPAPAPEPLSKPIKFRRSELVRAERSIDEIENDSRAIVEYTASPSSADSVIDETLDSEFTDGLPIESPPSASEATFAGVSLNETVTSPPDETDSRSFSGEIQHVAAEAPADETPSSPAARGRASAWEDEAFAEELLLGKKSSAKSDDYLTEPAFAATTSDTQTAPEDGFPRQRVVQLRRRLERAASLNPGGSYTMPASPATDLASATRTASTPRSETPEPASHVPSIASSEPTDGWMTSTDTAEPPKQQTVIKSEPTPKERQVVRLREHRVLPDHVRAALLQAAALPPAPAARRLIVGYSEPMLWQSAAEPDSVLPTLSSANGIGRGTSGAHAATGASTPPDLRDLAHSERQSVETPHAGQRVIPAASVKQTGFLSSELPSDTIQLIEPSAPEFSLPDSTLADQAPSSSLSAPDSIVTTARTAKRPTPAAGQSPTASKSKASHEVSRHSFAIIEPLAAALKLPLATTASLLGGVGLTLLGLGLLLVRTAIRWRHS